MSGEDRLLILAPRGRDAAVICGQLKETGANATVATAAEVVDAIVAGSLGAAVITDEAMAGFDLVALAAALAAQPPWSDIPFVILTRREFGGWTRARLMVLFGNLTILERPLYSDVLIGSVRSALRARARQRRAEAYLLARESAEAQVRELAATLETRVIERTQALSDALAERAETQNRLRDSEALYRYTVELTEQTPWTADNHGQMIGIGPGWASPEGTTSDWLRLVHVDDFATMSAAWTLAVKQLTPFQCDFRLAGSGGDFTWCRARAAPRLAADHSVLGWYGTLEDIEDQRAAEARLRQMQAELIHVSRLSAMGTMASTLAHELNQPLTAITNYVRGSRAMLAGYPEHGAVRDALDQADSNALRAGEIIRRVRDVASNSDARRRSEDLSALIREACGLAMVDAPLSGIEFELDLAAFQVRVMVDRIQIQQVLLNLLRNAVEAVAAVPVRRIMVSSFVTPTGFAEIVVRDTGPGVGADAAPRLFESFNTTKADGMGIGLSISRTIIEAHGGVIWHRARSGGGAAFGFSLARSDLGA